MTLEELFKKLAIRYDEKEPYFKYELRIKTFDTIDEDETEPILNAEINFQNKTITFQDYKEIK